MKLTQRLKNLLNKILGRSDIVFGNSVYMLRWRIFHNRWFGVRVHKIVRSDSDRALHDHPFDFLSVILWGGYFEYTPATENDQHLAELYGNQFLVKKWYGMGSRIFRPAEALHRLELEQSFDGYPVVQDKPAWTIVFRGPMKRHWGFVDEGVWIPNEEFIVLEDGGNS